MSAFITRLPFPILAEELPIVEQPFIVRLTPRSAERFRALAKKRTVAVGKVIQCFGSLAPKAYLLETGAFAIAGAAKVDFEWAGVRQLFGIPECFWEGAGNCRLTARKDSTFYEIGKARLKQFLADDRQARETVIRALSARNQRVQKCLRSICEFPDIFGPL